MTKQYTCILPFILVLSIWLPSYAQSDSSVTEAFEPEESAGSCQAYFDSNKVSINYSYSVANQTHDYSNNWDFDGDGNTDGLYFIGTGGAHLYFYLRIILSSDKKIRNYSFLLLDIPCYGDITELKNAGFYPPPILPQFTVDTFLNGGLGNDTNDKIYLHLDNQTTIPAEWKKRGVTSHYLLLRYDQGEMVIKNFIE